MAKKLIMGSIVGLLVALVWLASCAPAEAPAGDSSSSIYLIVFLVLIFGMFYFLFIRPQRKRQKEHQELVQELKRGDQVITAGGIYGQIESVSQDSFVLRVESGATLRIARSSVIGKRGKQF